MTRHWATLPLRCGLERPKPVDSARIGCDTCVVVAMRRCAVAHGIATSQQALRGGACMALWAPRIRCVAAHAWRPGPRAYAGAGAERVGGIARDQWQWVP